GPSRSDLAYIRGRPCWPSPPAVRFALHCGRRRLAALKRHARKGSLRAKRLDVDNLARLLAFGPHAGEDVGIRAFLHVDMARIDRRGQEIRAPFASFHIEPLN